ncbi:N-acetylglucosaminylphosphatidylinositol deacetylase [Entamoeba marina]
MVSVGLLVVCCIAIIYIALEAFCHKYLTQKLDIREPILFLFAHPDDDAMFFVPTLQHLKDHFIPFHFFSFTSTAIREQEFMNAAKYFNADTVAVGDPSKYKDGFNEKWDVMEMAQDVTKLINENNIQTIITFDGLGVSNHPNHIEINKALPMITTLNPHISVFTLKSKSFFRKYLHILDCILSIFQHSTNSLTTVLNSNQNASNAMKVYPSQLVWYRYIYLYFSTYTKLNELTCYR